MLSKTFIPVVLMLAAVMVSGCLTGPSGSDCGSDEQCFANAVSVCTHATIKTAEKTENFGVIDVPYVLTGEVMGPEAGSCLVEFNIKEISLMGNISQTPARLVYLFYVMVDEPLLCVTDEPIQLTLEGLAGAGQCRGGMKEYLDQAMEFKQGEVIIKQLQVLEPNCTLGKHLVVYVRNIGTVSIDTSELRVFNLTTQDVIPVEWETLDGFTTATELQPFEIYKFELASPQLTKHKYAIVLEKEAYPITYVCQIPVSFNVTAA